MAFMPFVTAGDPDLKATQDTIRELAAAGVDLIELGFPYSDPIADGPVIQASYTRALNRGIKSGADCSIEAELYGAELEVQLQPLLALVPEAIENLRFDLRFGWNESEFLDFTNTVIRAIAPGPLRPPEFFPVTADLSGNQLVNAPRFKINLGVGWEFNLQRLGTITPRYDGSWSDDVFFGPNEGRGSLNALGDPGLPEFGVGQPAYWVHNFSLRYSPGENGTLEFLGWVRNMTNERYKTFAFDGSTFAGQTVNFIAEPRTYGGTVTVSF